MDDEVTRGVTTLRSRSAEEREGDAWQAAYSEALVGDEPIRHIVSAAVQEAQGGRRRPNETADQRTAREALELEDTLADLVHRLGDVRNVSDVDAGRTVKAWWIALCTASADQAVKREGE